MFLENIRSPLVYILSKEREKILLVCLQVREDQKEQTNVFITSAELPAKRLSTAFDSVTLYGNDPHTRPDIYGKIGNAGVSICCLDDKNYILVLI
jgi:methylmalonyl-CoA mutase N-terminal domain/subunit